MLNFLRTEQVQHNFDFTVITTYDIQYFVYILVCYKKSQPFAGLVYLVYFRNMFLEKMNNL